MQLTQILRPAVTEQPDRLGTVYQGRRRAWREIGVRVPRMAALGKQIPAIRAWRVGVNKLEGPISWDLTMKLINARDRIGRAAA